MKKVLNVFLIILASIGAFMSILYVYVKTTKPTIYTNSSSTYITSVTNPQTGEKLTPFEVRYFANYNNTGKEVIEFCIRAYSDQNKQAIYYRGYQLVFDSDGSSKLYYCDGYNGQYWESMHPYDEIDKDGQYKEFYYLDIDGKVYAIRLDGFTEVEVRKQNNIPFLRNLGNAIANFVTFHWKQSSVVDYCKAYIDEIEPYYYTYSDLLVQMTKLIKSSTQGTGFYRMPLVDLGKFIHVYDVDEVGKADPQPIGDGGLINSYFSLDITYNKRGMTYAGQSIFGSVEGDSDFNITGIDYDVNYWKAVQTFNLSELDFEKRYSSAESGYYYSLSPKIINELKKYENIEIDVVFNVSNLKNVNVLGFDYYALNGLKINQLTISCNKQMNFTFLVGSLQDTSLQKVKLHNVTINNVSGSEVQYEVV